MKRLNQFILIGSFLPFCWLAMMAVHELGHVLAAWATGGKVTKVVLHPLAISRTDVVNRSHPLAVVWGGPVVGMLLPLLVWLVFHCFRLPGSYLPRFFAGFCLIANGVYLGVGSFTRVGDADELLRNGAPTWQLWLFGLLTVPPGIALWNNLGPHFGLGEARGNVDAWAAYLVLFLAALTLALMFGLSTR